MRASVCECVCVCVLSEQEKVPPGTVFVVDFDKSIRLLLMLSFIFCCCSYTNTILLSNGSSRLQYCSVDVVVRLSS